MLLVTGKLILHPLVFMHAHAVLLLCQTRGAISTLYGPVISRGVYCAWALANKLPPHSRPRSRANGATQTFRRPSLATNVANSRESNYGAGQAIATPTSGVYVPPHLNTNSQVNLRNGVVGELRYSKDQLIVLYKQQRDAGAIDQNLSSIFTGGWNPLDNRESTSAWSRRDEGKETSVGPEVCWDHSANSEPLALIQMSDEEREVCF
jgi:PERQ amino acid-rich with GYF domain-containing protein